VIRWDSHPEYSVDTVANLVIKRGSRPMNVSHWAAVTTFWQFARQNATDAWLARLKEHPAFQRGKSLFENAGRHTTSRRAVRAPHTTGLNLGSAGERPPGRTLGVRRQPASLRAREPGLIVGASAMPSTTPQLGVANGGPSPEAEREPARLGGSVGAVDFCDDLSMLIYNATAQYYADQAAFATMQDSVLNEFLNDGKVDANDAAELVADGIIVIQDNTELNYYAIEFNQANCFQANPIPDYDAYWSWSSGTYINEDGDQCEDQEWLVYVSYDDGNTWSYDHTEDFTTCQYAE
jgi:hypothetical protein